MKPRPSYLRPVTVTPRARVSVQVKHTVVDPTVYFVERPVGATVVVAARVSMEMKARIQEAVQSGKFDFANESDLTRSALHWFMHQVLGPKMDGGFQDDVRRSTAAVRRLQALRRVNNIDKLVDEVIATVVELEAKGAADLADQTYLDAVEEVKRMNDPFRGLGLKRLKEDGKLEGARRRTKGRR